MKYLSLALILIIPFFSFSQIIVKGKVKDSISYIEFANVILMDVDNNFVSGSITNDEGSFTIKSNKGKYNLKVSFIKGFSDVNRREFYILLPLAFLTILFGIYPDPILNKLHLVNVYN